MTEPIGARSCSGGDPENWLTRDEQAAVRRCSERFDWLRRVLQNACDEASAALAPFFAQMEARPVLSAREEDLFRFASGAGKLLDLTFGISDDLTTACEWLR